MTDTATMDLSRLVPVAAVLGVCVVASVAVGLVAGSPARPVDRADVDHVDANPVMPLPTPTAFPIDPSPVSLRELGLTDSAVRALEAARWPADHCNGGPLRSEGWSERVDADLDGDGVSDVVRLRAGPVINPGRGLVEMAVEFGDGRVHRGRLPDHRLGIETVVAATSSGRQARPIRVDGASHDVILFTNPEPRLDASVGPTTWVIGMRNCRPVILAGAGVQGETWCPAGRDRETRIEFPESRLRAGATDENVAVLLPSCADPDEVAAD